MKRNPFFAYALWVEGLNLERLLHLLQEADIPLLSARREGARRLRLLCFEADRQTILALLAEKGWTLKSEAPRGLSQARERLRRHKALPIALAVCATAVIISLQFVWAVRIEGARMYAGDLASFLLEEDIRPGKLKRTVDIKGLEAQLYLRYPRIAWVTVYLQGSTLVVDCRLGEYAEERQKQPGNLVAARDGIIVSVLTRGGTARVEPGQVVRAGELLIEGVERVANEETLPVRASGAVIARVWESAEAIVAMYGVESTPTGRILRQQSVRTPWLDWPRMNEPSYLAYDREITVTPLVGCFFPVWLERIEDAEVALERRSRPVSIAKAEAEQAAWRILSKRLHGNQIIDKWVDYCMIEGGKISAIVTAELRLDIATPADEWTGGILIDPTATVP